ncbi:MAG: penicillin acylase family protein [Verrucomicrobiaceae bacterium]|nr:penicillin acylase family protein [Verrucomicrobiaceae bacterium]
MNASRFRLPVCHAWMVLALFHGCCTAAETAESLLKRSQALLAQVVGETRLPGLKEEVRVVRDRWGIAHIEARNTHDLFFAQGFVVAQDRLFQIDLWRRTGCGEMAEIQGEDALEGDRFARLMQYHGDMEAEWRSYAPDTREIATAFAAGINAFIMQAGVEGLPVEFQLLGHRPRPWRAEDVLPRISGLIMSGNWQRELSRARLIAEAGAETARRLAPTDPPRELALDPLLEPEIFKADIAAAYAAATKAPAFKTSLHESNNWVASGALTASGKPMLAGDPHRTLALPSLRYLVHLRAPGWNVIGSGEPALPGVAIGHNERIAWAFTIVGTDQADLFVEKTHPEDPRRYLAGDEWLSMETRQEIFRVRGKTQPVTQELRFTRHGPVIYQDEKKHIAIALRWAGLEPGGAAYLGSLSVARAQDRAGFLKALEAWKIPCLNFVFASVDGDTGWIAAAATPVREGWDGLLPVPGWTNAYRWTRFLPVKDYPQLFQPSAGWIGTANHNILPPGYPHTIAYDWAPPFRYERIHERMEEMKAAGHKLTIEDFQRLQQDSTSTAARSLVALWREVPASDDLKPMVKLLAEWDGHLATGSAAAALYSMWLVELEQAFWQQSVAATDSKLERGSVKSLPVMIQALRQPGTAWFGQNPVPQRDVLMLKTLSTAVIKLRKTLGDDPARWAWGDLHKAAFQHPLAGLSEAHAAAFNPVPVPRPGDETTPNNTKSDAAFRQIHGATYRHIFDLADWDLGVATSAPGQSGQPGSPHYADLLPLWARGEYFPLAFSARKVAEVAKHTLVLQPVRK